MPIIRRMLVLAITSRLPAIVCLLSLIAGTGRCAEPDNVGFANCNFEQGVAGWGIWYSDDCNAVMTAEANV